MLKLLEIPIKRPIVVLLALLAISVFLFQQMKSNSRMETDLDEYMPRDHPAFIYSDQAEEWFDIKDGIIIAIEHPAGIYNSGTLGKVKQLTKDLQNLEEIDKNDVTSLYTADNIVGTEDGLDVKAFYKDVPDSVDELAEIRNNVRGNDMVYERLVSQDENVTLIIAQIKDDVFTQEFYTRILDLARSYEGPEKLHVAGRPIVEGTMALLGPADMKKMVPIVIVVIILLLLVLLRSVKNTVITITVVFLSTVWTFGLMALLGIPIYAVSTMIPVMLIAIGVADGLHLFSHLELYVTANPTSTKKDAVREMLKELWKPVVMTSVTTAVGFFSLLTSEVYPIKYFGLFTAFGVSVALLFSLVLLPAGIMLVGLPKPRMAKNQKDNKQISKFADWFTVILMKHKWLTLSLTTVILTVSIYGTSKIWINSSFLDKFERDSDIVQTDMFINEHFGGTSTLNLILESSEPGAFKSPEALKLANELQRDVETIKIVGNSFGLTDYLKRMNQVMHADNRDYNIIPESSELNAQYLLLYEMSGDPDNLWKVTDPEYRKLNMVFQLKSDNSKAINEAIDRIENYRERFEKSGIRLNYAGSGYKGLVFTELVLEGQVKSLLLTLIIMIALLSLMFKSIKAGWIGTVPVVITAAISFGVMGILGIPLSSTTALLSSISIGIGIDFAVHFIDRYRQNLLKRGSTYMAIQDTMHSTGRAIVFNAIVVIAGFMALLFSVFPPNRQLGGLVSLNMFTSFVGTLTVMVLLIHHTNLFSSKQKSNQIDNK